jgi:tetratricopeptide (TPR) repeat protein
VSTSVRIALFLCFTLACALPVFAQQSSPSATAEPPAPDEVAQKAGAAREAGRLQEAIGLYRQSVKNHPDWVEGWWYLGTLLYDRDQYAEGKEAFKQVVASDPKNGTALAMLSLCEFGVKEYEQSLADMERARNLGMASSIEFLSVARYHDGILLTKFGRFREGNEALQYLAKYQNKSPDVVEAFGLNVLEMQLLPGETPADKRDLVVKVGNAIFCMQARRPVEAKAAFEELVGKYPSTPRLHYFYGVFLVGEHSDAAIEQFKRELEITPNDVYALLQIANEYINRSDYTAALPYAQKAVGLAEGEAAPHIALGRILVETGKLEEGISELELAARFNPENSKAHFALAHAYGRAQRKEDATRERQIFMRLDAAERARWGRPDGPIGPIPSVDDKPDGKPTDKPEK